MKLIGGIDEAGRGALIGPMIMAFVAVSDIKKIDFITKDSKQLTPKKRDKIEKIIKNNADIVETKIISPKEIDENNINALESNVAKYFIDTYKPYKVYIDAFSKKFPKKIGGSLIIFEPKADEHYPIVAAASIIAKVKRDNEIKNIEKTLNIKIGSGYPADPYTINAVEKHYKLLYPYIRKKWKTLKHINIKQKKLFD